MAGLGDRALAALRARHIGFVFQQFFLLDGMTALENVATGLLYAGVPPAERRAQAARACSSGSASATGSAHHPAMLSGGERQRVAIARALVGRPSIVFADEPTGNLDSRSGAEIVALLRELNDEGKTIVVITHDRDIAAAMPRRIEVRDGLVVDMTPGDVLRTGAIGLRTRRLRAVLSAVGIAIGIASMVAVLGISESRAADLLAEIDRLGTNLLRVAPGQTFTGDDVDLPDTAAAMIRRVDGGRRDRGDDGDRRHGAPHRPDPEEETGGITVDGGRPVGCRRRSARTLAKGRFLDAATARYPIIVLGAVAAERLGIDRTRRARLARRPLVHGRRDPRAGHARGPEIDRAALIGFAVAADAVRTGRLGATHLRARRTGRDPAGRDTARRDGEPGAPGGGAT